MSEQAKGLPGELKDVFGVYAAFENKEPPSKLLSAAKKAKSAEKKAELIGNIKLVDSNGCTTPLKIFVTSHHSQLVNLFDRRKDLTPFVKPNDNTYIDVVAFLEEIQEARTKAIKGKTKSVADANINYRAGEYHRDETILQFSSAFKLVNTADDIFFSKYFAIKKEGSQIRTVLVDREDHCTMYPIPDLNTDDIEDVPESLLSRINDDITTYVSAFDNFLRNTSPEIENIHESVNKVITWASVQKGDHTVDEYVDFIDNYLIERAFDDEWCKANGREPIPHLVLLMHDSVYAVIHSETIETDSGKTMTVDTPVRYELGFSKYSGPKGYVTKLFKMIDSHKYDSYNVPAPLDVLPLSNTDGELCRHFLELPKSYKTRSTNNDELLQEAIKLCGPEITEYFKTLWRIDGDTDQAKLSREQLGREMFFVGATIDARGMGSQALASADGGGNGKSGFNLDFIGHALNHATDSTFCTFQDSNIFTQDFSGRSNVFDSILCIVDEYDGRSALDDKSWFKKVTGANSQDATFSTKELNRKNIDHNVSHMKFMFLCNVETMVLGSDAARRRTLPVVFDGLEGNYDFKNELPNLKKHFDQFLQGCWHYYNHTALRNKADDYLILTPEEYLKFLTDGIVPYTQTKDAARNAFMNDPRLQNHYTMMDFTNKWANDELYTELFDACFVADENSVVIAKDVYRHVADTYQNTDSLRSQGLLEFDKGEDDFKRGKGTGWCSFNKWISKKYPFVNFKFKNNSKICVKGLKLVEKDV